MDQISKLVAISCFGILACTEADYHKIKLTPIVDVSELGYMKSDRVLLAHRSVRSVFDQYASNNQRDFLALEFVDGLDPESPLDSAGPHHDDRDDTDPSCDQLSSTGATRASPSSARASERAKRAVRPPGTPATTRPDRATDRNDVPTMPSAASASVALGRSAHVVDSEFASACQTRSSTGSAVIAVHVQRAHPCPTAHRTPLLLACTKAITTHAKAPTRPTCSTTSAIPHLQHAERAQHLPHSARRHRTRARTDRIDTTSTSRTTPTTMAAATPPRVPARPLSAATAGVGSLRLVHSANRGPMPPASSVSGSASSDASAPAWLADLLDLFADAALDLVVPARALDAASPSPSRSASLHAIADSLTATLPLPHTAALSPAVRDVAYMDEILPAYVAVRVARRTSRVTLERLAGTLEIAVQATVGGETAGVPPYQASHVFPPRRLRPIVDADASVVLVPMPVPVPAVDAAGGDAHLALLVTVTLSVLAGASAADEQQHGPASLVPDDAVAPSPNSAGSSSSSSDWMPDTYDAINLLSGLVLDTHLPPPAVTLHRPARSSRSPSTASPAAQAVVQGAPPPRRVLQKQFRVVPALAATIECTPQRARDDAVLISVVLENTALDSHAPLIITDVRVRGRAADAAPIAAPLKLPHTLRQHDQLAVVFAHTLAFGAPASRPPAPAVTSTPPTPAVLPQPAPPVPQSQPSRPRSRSRSRSRSKTRNDQVVPIVPPVPPPVPIPTSTPPAPANDGLDDASVLAMTVAVHYTRGTAPMAVAVWECKLANPLPLFRAVPRGFAASDDAVTTARARRTARSRSRSRSRDRGAGAVNGMMAPMLPARDPTGAGAARVHRLSIKQRMSLTDEAKYQMSRAFNGARALASTIGVDSPVSETPPATASGILVASDEPPFVANVAPAAAPPSLLPTGGASSASLPAHQARGAVIVTLAIVPATGPGAVIRPGDRFFLDVLVINRTHAMKAYAIDVPPPTTVPAPPAESSLLLDAAAWTRAVARAKGRAHGVLCLANHVVVPPVAPGGVVRVRIAYMAVREGVHDVGRLRVLETGSGEVVEVAETMHVAVV
ncbi:hypothetical protein GGF31_008668 [Allomyces arbusculus]|nr:hypothetical protein GGF31_008668 [Allomyces arbusculus]